MSLAKVRGIRNKKLVVITDSGDFTSMPTMIHSHDTAKQKTRTSPTAIATPNQPPTGRKPKMKPTMMMSAEAMEYRSTSPASAPNNGDGCHIGSDRKRSYTPFLMSL